MSNIAWAKNLERNELGGVVFLCSNGTTRECLDSQLFGLPDQHFLYIKNIKPGLPLFLFNYKQRKFHGIYEASSSDQMNINLHAWTQNDSERTKYPAQVQIVTRLLCQALNEHQFMPLISDNSFTETRFWYELDHAQARKLLFKLATLAIGLQPIMSQNSANRKAVEEREENKDSEPQSLIDSNSIDSDGTSDIPEDCLHLNEKNQSGEASLPNPMVECDENRASEPRPSIDSNSIDSVGTSDIPDDSLHLNGKKQFGEASFPNRMVECDEKDFILMKLKELAVNCEYADANIMGRGIEADADYDADKGQEALENTMMALEKTDGKNSYYSSHCHTVKAELHAEVEELKAFSQEQTQKMANLEKRPAKTEQVMYCLENRHTTLESNHHDALKESILLVGGCDGVSYSSALNAFSPPLDVVRSLQPMSTARAGASAAILNGELYIFGGAVDDELYDIVESYNFVNKEWTIRPHMWIKRNMFAGAALNGKLFAAGGGIGSQCFSSMEMLDLLLGHWIPVRSMRARRLASASVELNGVLYVTGGFNGNDYLKTAERFDPREHSWSRICEMNIKRAGHSLVAMNEKLYAIGGCDSLNIVPDMDIYEPRVGVWMRGLPMNQERGYFSAAVLNNSIYAIGGLRDDEEVLDTIECYKDGEGWTTTDLRTLGETSFAATIAYEGNDFID